MSQTESVVFNFTTEGANSSVGFSKNFDLTLRPISMVIKNNTPFEGSVQYANQSDSYDAPPYAMAVYRVSAATQQRGSFAVVPNTASTIPTQAWNVRVLFTDAELPPGIYSTAPTIPGPKQAVTNAPSQVYVTNSSGPPNGTRILDSSGGAIDSLGSALAYNGGIGRSLMTVDQQFLAAQAAEGNASAIAATSWGNVLSVTFGTLTGLHAIFYAGATLDAAIAAQTGAWRITQAGVVVREFLVPSGVSVANDVRLGLIDTASGAVTMNLDWYNTASAALAIGTVRAWWAYL